MLASAIDRERAAYKGRTLLVNVGDTIHGSAVAEWTQGAALIPIVNALGIDLFVPGNWEYAYGPEVFRKRMAELNHPVIALNVHDAATGKRLFAPSLEGAQIVLLATELGLSQEVQLAREIRPTSISFSAAIRMSGRRDPFSKAARRSSSRAPRARFSRGWSSRFETGRSSPTSTSSWRSRRSTTSRLGGWRHSWRAPSSPIAPVWTA